MTIEEAWKETDKNNKEEGEEKIRDFSPERETPPQETASGKVPEENISPLELELKKKEEEILSLKEKLSEKEAQVQTLIAELKKEIASSLSRQSMHEREMKALKERANEELLRKLVEVQENFQRALQALKGSENSPLKLGVELIYKQLEDLLKKEGVEEIPSVGSPFDCNLHEAEGFVETDSCPDGVITEELQKGYTYKGKILRPAKVRVARNQKETQKETEE
ncbi:MAG: nucleotide exchange factor GrpE [Caldiserica bacterium]|jgi:molecular chaperone GrpE|nr:nucleotide exchange factor GrpE [Caldisericota bacterium]MDH7561826.1 nucleotide exchange factor GrpE [Caldisericota bacterium]